MSEQVAQTDAISWSSSIITTSRASRAWENPVVYIRFSCIAQSIVLGYPVLSRPGLQVLRVLASLGRLHVVYQVRWRRDRAP